MQQRCVLCSWQRHETRVTFLKFSIGRGHRCALSIDWIRWKYGLIDYSAQMSTIFDAEFVMRIQKPSNDDHQNDKHNSGLIALP